jgi:phage-related tail protein
MSGFSALAEDDSRLARLFTLLGVGGLVAAVLAGALGVTVVLTAANSMDRSLDVTAGAVIAADETVALAADTIGIVSESFDTLVPSADLAADAFGEAATVIAETTTVVTVDVPDALDAVLDAMPAIESAATVVDGALRVLSFVGVDYDPEVPFGEAVAELETALADLPAQLRAQAEPLDALAEDFDEFGDATAEIADDLVALQLQLDEAERLLATYSSTAEEATAVVADIQSDLKWQRWLMVAAVLLVALGFGAIQVVPLALAERLKAE